MKKKVLAAILASALTLGLFAGCGSSGESNQNTQGDENAAGTETVASTETAEETGESKTIKVGASATPHAEILEVAKPILAEAGYELEITVFDDYIIPNEVVESNEMDANYFQHVLYLNNFNAERNTHLVNAGGIHYEPLGIYPGKKADLAELTSGDEIAVPNDATNEARALLLLEEQGIIKLKEGAGLTATKNDIEEYLIDVEIRELAAEQIARVKEDFAVIVLNGNYALQAGFSADKDALACEDANSEAIQNYVNVIAVKEGNENNEAIKALIEVLKSDAVKEYINSTYEGSVISFE